jgi:hypothetical protein
MSHGIQRLTSMLSKVKTNFALSPSKPLREINGTWVHEMLVEIAHLAWQILVTI